MTLFEKVEQAMRTAQEQGDSIAPFIKMIYSQLRAYVRVRKSGDDIPDSKVADLLNRTIRAVKRDQQISNSSEEEANRRIEFLTKLMS